MSDLRASLVNLPQVKSDQQSENSFSPTNQNSPLGQLEKHLLRSVASGKPTKKSVHFAPDNQLITKHLIETKEEIAEKRETSTPQENWDLAKGNLNEDVNRGFVQIKKFETHPTESSREAFIQEEAGRNNNIRQKANALFNLLSKHPELQTAEHIQDLETQLQSIINCQIAKASILPQEENSTITEKLIHYQEALSNIKNDLQHSDEELEHLFRQMTPPLIPEETTPEETSTILTNYRNEAAQFFALEIITIGNEILNVSIPFQQESSLSERKSERKELEAAWTIAQSQARENLENTQNWIKELTSNEETHPGTFSERFIAEHQDFFNPLQESTEELLEQIKSHDELCTTKNTHNLINHLEQIHTIIERRLESIPYQAAKELNDLMAPVKEELKNARNFLRTSDDILYRIAQQQKPNVEITDKDIIQLRNKIIGNTIFDALKSADKILNGLSQLSSTSDQKTFQIWLVSLQELCDDPEETIYQDTLTDFINYFRSVISYHFSLVPPEQQNFREQLESQDIILQKILSDLEINFPTFQEVQLSAEESKELREDSSEHSQEKPLTPEKITFLRTKGEETLRVGKAISTLLKQLGELEKSKQKAPSKK